MQKSQFDIDSLIDLVLFSNDLGQISTGAALMEYLELSEKIEFREKLIKKLEYYYLNPIFKNSEFDIKRLNSIIINNSLFVDTNRRSIVEKNDKEIIELELLQGYC